MSRVERFFERLVERPSARIFKTRLQPIHILRRIERAMDADRGIEGRRGLVPDQFVVRLHPDELAVLAPADETAAELASGALSFARAHGYALRDRPRVTLQPDPRLRLGEAEVDATVSPVQEAILGADLADGGTRVYEVPVPRAPDVMVEVREPGRKPRRLQVGSTPIHIGRAPECELVLRDSRVSRKHARLAARDGVLVLTDLGSTNGTRVNGHRVTQVALGAGDRIELGESSLIVAAAAEPVAAPAEAGARP